MLMWISSEMTKIIEIQAKFWQLELMFLVLIQYTPSTNDHKKTDKTLNPVETFILHGLIENQSNEMNQKVSVKASQWLWIMNQGNCLPAKLNISLSQVERECSCSLQLDSVGPLAASFIIGKSLNNKTCCLLVFLSTVRTLVISVSNPATPDKKMEKNIENERLAVFWLGKMLETCSTFRKNIFQSAVWLVTPIKYFDVSAEFFCI